MDCIVFAGVFCTLEVLQNINKKYMLGVPLTFLD